MGPLGASSCLSEHVLRFEKDDGCAIAAVEGGRFWLGHGSDLGRSLLYLADHQYVFDKYRDEGT